MGNMEETPEEAKYTLEEIEYMDKCGILPKDFKEIKDHANTQFDQMNWLSYLTGVECGASLCMENLGKDASLPPSTRQNICLVMKQHESEEFRGHHMLKLAELIAGIISGKIDPDNIKNAPAR